jgi:acetyl esterase
MTLDAPVQAFLDAMPKESHDHLGLAERRLLAARQLDFLFLRFGEAGPKVHSVVDHRLPVEGGEIATRVYRPDDDELLPGLLCLHGGGWWTGSIDDLVVDARCREIAVGAHCVVVSVDYRLAPEHRFPIAVEDCYAALCWMAGQADSLGLDRTRIAIGGASAGANLSAAVCLKARDEGGPAIVLQVLEVPAVDLSRPLPKVDEPGGIYLSEADEFNHVVGLYVTEPGEALNQLVSPMLAASHANLPRAHIMTAEFDPLRPQGERFAERLRAAGVPVSITDHPGATHGSSLLTHAWEPARAWRAEIIDAVRSMGRATEAFTRRG